jgi:hypothetical protein
VSGCEYLGQHAAVEDVPRPDAFSFAGPDESAFLAEFRECPRELSNLIESYRKDARGNKGLRLGGHVSRETRRA